MTVPLMILAGLSILGGFVQVPLLAGGQRLDHFLEPVFADTIPFTTGAGAPPPVRRWRSWSSRSSWP